MNQTDSRADITPVELNLDSSFTFKCHKGLTCFTQCCSGVNIILTPYDIIRLKNRLQLLSEEFLALYTAPQLLEKTGLPVVTLKLLENEATSCPFVNEQGCFVYEDRPATCRYYPLGVASMSYSETSDNEFYFFVNEPHCLGFEEDRKWVIRKWREDQGVDLYDKINAPWVDLLVRKRSFPPNMSLTEDSKKMFFLVSYNIDKFRQFVFESSFLKRYPTKDRILATIKEDELALLEFGLRWLKGLLFKMPAQAGS